MAVISGEISADIKPATPFQAWSSVGIMMVLLLFSLLDRQIISLLVDPIKKDLHISDTQVGLLQGLAFVTFYAACAIPIGWAVDRYPRRIICYLGVTVWSLGATACGLASTFTQLFAARLSVGAGEATMSPVSVSLVSDLFPPHKIGTAMGIYAMAISLGAGAALMIGGFVVSLFAGHAHIDFPLIGAVAPWQAAFIVTGLPGLVVALLAFLLTDPRPKGMIAQKGGDADGRFKAYAATHWKVVLLTYLAFGFAAFTFYTVAAWTPTFLSRHFGLPARDIGYAWGLVVMLAGAAGCLLGGLIIDRVVKSGRDDAPLLVPTCSALSAWPILVGSYMLPSPTLVLIGLGIATVLIGITSASSLAVWQRIAPPEVRGRITAGFGIASTGFGASLGPVAVALLTDHVFGDPGRVGWSLSVAVAVSQPAIALSLYGARVMLRRVEGRA